MLIDSAQARDISIICHLWNYLEPSLKPGEKVGGAAVPWGGLVVGGGVAVVWAVMNDCMGFWVLLPAPGL